ncbi:hypothetical protein DVJ78_18090 (plasmid) [Humibacter sp. BT305]|uniref:Uncharacterized protein n=1 Tax=Cnuibacter physcomitrellae TaxID=1619308 RepID=A0A1X9LTY6_9MICO|nr:hypothetical protein [Cnuibacter physcomitrellae]ARJ07788.1 hypothetical protein B5808_20575 [Cnuibacter physcomitrellae]AXH37488.1 hypothetical protein DVJ78_18090 [Humibacter sp. BT305]GGI42920.1 hypothetical protein GCM10010988_41450 [Cnuibacter physcomitrellae]
MSDEIPAIGNATAANAELSPAVLLSIIAGKPSPEVAARVRSVLEHAAIEAVYEDGPVGVDDPVLTLDFQHSFTRREVMMLLSELHSLELG